ncbi:NYN domain-containing protein [Chlorobaculum sp. 24CR]|uniref:NYN domain-containing protein n=1 Tax=Chlorobaculum sp. 24CR TaxID=2508878 RepID=UPI00100B73EB|nr:NYN domain-containing protein [Chlorobaculum sp. 24CR]RXK88164.1 NYN domain-containing protein [Chlorobaculum sp. 24CR]
MTNRRLWLIDAGYLFNARHSVSSGYEFNYLKLREKIEQDGPIWRAYYFNSIPSPPGEAQESFHNWLQSAPPNGPKIITRLYGLKYQRGDRAYCETCNQKVSLTCPHQRAGEQRHILKNEVQKGVDVGIATAALIHQNNYDTLILSTGDGDLLDAIEYLSESGKRIELVVFDNSVSTDLQCRADKLYLINDFADEVGN